MNKDKALTYNQQIATERYAADVREKIVNFNKEILNLLDGLDASIKGISTDTEGVSFIEDIKKDIGDLRLRIQTLSDEIEAIGPNPDLSKISALYDKIKTVYKLVYNLYGLIGKPVYEHNFYHDSNDNLITQVDSVVYIPKGTLFSIKLRTYNSSYHYSDDDFVKVKMWKTEDGSSNPFGYCFYDPNGSINSSTPVQNPGLVEYKTNINSEYCECISVFKFDNLDIDQGFFLSEVENKKAITHEKIDYELIIEYVEPYNIKEKVSYLFGDELFKETYRLNGTAPGTSTEKRIDYKLLKNKPYKLYLLLPFDGYQANEEQVIGEIYYKKSDGTYEVLYDFTDYELSTIPLEIPISARPYNIENIYIDFYTSHDYYSYLHNIEVSLYSGLSFEEYDITQHSNEIENMNFRKIVHLEFNSGLPNNLDESRLYYLDFDHTSLLAQNIYGSSLVNGVKEGIFYQVNDVPTNSLDGNNDRIYNDERHYINRINNEHYVQVRYDSSDTWWMWNKIEQDYSEIINDDTFDEYDVIRNLNARWGGGTTESGSGINSIFAITPDLSVPIENDPLKDYYGKVVNLRIFDEGDDTSIYLDDHIVLVDDEISLLYTTPRFNKDSSEYGDFTIAQFVVIITSGNDFRLYRRLWYENSNIWSDLKRYYPNIETDKLNGFDPDGSVISNESKTITHLDGRTEPYLDASERIPNALAVYNSIRAFGDAKISYNIIFDDKMIPNYAAPNSMSMPYDVLRRGSFIYFNKGFTNFSDTLAAAIIREDSNIKKIYFDNPQASVSIGANAAQLIEDYDIDIIYNDEFTVSELLVKGIINLYENCNDNRSSVNNPISFGSDGSVIGYRDFGSSTHINASDIPIETVTLFVDSKIQTISSNLYTNRTSLTTILVDNYPENIELNLPEGSTIHVRYRGTFSIYGFLAKSQKALNDRISALESD